MPVHASTIRLSAADAESFVREWLRRAGTGAATEELLPACANGLRIDLPEQTLRGVEEFSRWYPHGRRTFFDHYPRLAQATCALAQPSPLHVQVTLDTVEHSPGPALRVDCRVVLRHGAPRLRTMAITSAPVRAAAALQPVAAELAALRLAAPQLAAPQLAAAQ